MKDFYELQPAGILNYWMTEQLPKLRALMNDLHLQEECISGSLSVYAETICEFQSYDFLLKPLDIQVRAIKQLRIVVDNWCEISPFEKPDLIRYIQKEVFPGFGSRLNSRLKDIKLTAALNNLRQTLTIKGKLLNLVIHHWFRTQVDTLDKSIYQANSGNRDDKDIMMELCTKWIIKKQWIHFCKSTHSYLSRSFKNQKISFLKRMSGKNNPKTIPIDDKYLSMRSTQRDFSDCCHVVQIMERVRVYISDTISLEEIRDFFASRIKGVGRDLFLFMMDGHESTIELIEAFKKAGLEMDKNLLKSRKHQLRHKLIKIIWSDGHLLQIDLIDFGDN